MRRQTYGEFSQVLHQRVGGDRIPAKGAIEVTRRCPLACAHCYNNLPMGDAAARREELSYAEHCRILDEITDAGCLWLLFTGGEIFARADFLEIYAYAKRKGLLVTLFTNGTLITPRIADFLAEYRPFSIEITLYGYSQHTYERLTGVPGSHARCMRAIDLLLERGLPLKLKTVGVSLNVREIPQMERFARERGLEFKFDSLINPRVDCSQSPLAVRLTPEEIVALDLENPRRVASWRELAERTGETARAPRDADALYHCGGGVSAFAIDPYGGLSICVLSEREKYDLRRGSFAEGWDVFLKEVRGQRRTRPSKCVTCGLKAMCGMCPANGEMENGDREAPVDFLCHVAHLRAEAIGIHVPPHGDCEFCAGGARHAEIGGALPRLQRQLAEDGARQLFPLPMLNAAPSATGACGSCAAH